MIIQKSSDFTAERTGFILVEGKLQVPCRQLGKKKDQKLLFSTKKYERYLYFTLIFVTNS